MVFFAYVIKLWNVRHPFQYEKSDWMIETKQSISNGHFFWLPRIYFWCWWKRKNKIETNQKFFFYFLCAPTTFGSCPIATTNYERKETKMSWKSWLRSKAIIISLKEWNEKQPKNKKSWWTGLSKKFGIVDLLIRRKEKSLIWKFRTECQIIKISWKTVAPKSWVKFGFQTSVKI